MLLTIFFKTVMYLWYMLWAPIILAGLPSRKLSRRFVVACTNGILVWLRIFGIRYTVHGQFHPGAIVAAKHMSVFEIMILGKHCPYHFFFVVKRELFWIPVYGWALWRMGMIPVNRTKGSTNMKVLADRVAAEIKKGGMFMIFPEGTRVRPGMGVRLKSGILFIARTARVPIQPVGTDTGLYWPKRGRMRPGVANLWLEPVLPFDAELDEIATAIARHSA